MQSIIQKLKSLPSSPGVYIFRDKNRKILYVGKAGSLKDRVNSYFSPSPVPLSGTSSPASGRGGYGSRPIERFISEVKDLEIWKTDTVLEAYILEQELIKKFQPKYNVDGKDDKSFCYVVVTKEDFPRFIIMRKTDLDKNVGANLAFARKGQHIKIYGPYVSRHQIETALKILRRIFPYHSRKEKTEKGCLDYQIGLCPGPYDGAISKEDYQKNIRGVRMILEGKKKSLLNKMKKEMQEYSDRNEFEKAAETRNKIFALQHAQDITLISRNVERETRNTERFTLHTMRSKIRVEGYDISNISGKYAVGSMVVFDNNEDVGTRFIESLKSNKSQYRKFRIKTVEGANDVGSMEEVLARRFKNNWPRPNLIILDGGKGHLNMARKILRNYHLEIPLIAVAKGPTRKKLDIYSFGTIPEISQNIIEQVRDEAHRFAIKYHRKLRGREAITK